MFIVLWINCAVARIPLNKERLDSLKKYLHDLGCIETPTTPVELRQIDLALATKGDHALQQICTVQVHNDIMPLKGCIAGNFPAHVAAKIAHYQAVHGMNCNVFIPVNHCYEVPFRHSHWECIYYP